MGGKVVKNVAFYTTHLPMILGTLCRCSQHVYLPDIHKQYAHFNFKGHSPISKWDETKTHILRISVCCHSSRVSRCRLARLVNGAHRNVMYASPMRRIIRSCFPLYTLCLYTVRMRSVSRSRGDFCIGNALQDIYLPSPHQVIRQRSSR